MGPQYVILLATFTSTILTMILSCGVCPACVPIIEQSCTLVRVLYHSSTRKLPYGGCYYLQIYVFFSGDSLELTLFFYYLSR